MTRRAICTWRAIWISSSPPDALFETAAAAVIGSLAIWALLEIVLCNRRDGPRKELPSASLKGDVIAVVIGIVAFGVLGHFHVKLFGVSPL